MFLRLPLITGVERVFLFGSYARGEATPDSDLDFRVDCGDATDFFSLGLMYCDLEDKFQKPLDLLTTGSLDRKFLDRIGKDEVLIYPLPQRGRGSLSRNPAYSYL